LDNNISPELYWCYSETAIVIKCADIKHAFQWFSILDAFYAPTMDKKNYLKFGTCDKIFEGEFSVRD
jgi:hypothetical protein